MPTQQVRQRLAILLSLAFALTALVGLPVTSLIGVSTAHASVAVGDFVYTDRTSADTLLMLHNASGVHQLADVGNGGIPGSGGFGMAAPAISPDGSKVAFTMVNCNLPGSGNSCTSTLGESNVLVVVNTDGTPVLTAITSGSGTQNVADWEPTWSPDGTWIAFERVTGSSTGIYKIHPDGTGLTQMISDGNVNSDYMGLTWSPDGTKFAYAHYDSSTGHMKLMYSNTDGSGATVISNQPNPSMDDNSMPAWAPNSSRLYFQNWHFGTATIQGIDLAGTNLVQETNGGSAEMPSVSADGNTLIVSTGATFTDLFTVPTNGSKTQTNVTSDGSTYIHEWPSFAKAANPSAPTPNWWSGTCDSGNNSGSAPLTHSGVTTSFYGVIACGGGVGHSTNFGTTGSSESEWQCVELVKRYMYLRWGVIPYSANGYQIVSSYSGSIMTKVTNTGSNLPVVGDVISFNRVLPYDTTNGHTAIVTAVGPSSITTMEQHASTSGIGTVTISGGGISTTIVNGWLHHS